MSPDENTYVRDQNARVDPMFTLGTITVPGLRELLADLPDDAVVVVARDGLGGGDCSPLADGLINEDTQAEQPEPSLNLRGAGRSTGDQIPEAPGSGTAPTGPAC
jgi:hypothetical protein